MKHNKFSFCVALLALLALAGVFRVARSSTQETQSADAMLGAALHLEEVEGNLDAAIATYKRFIAQYGDNESLAATAQLHIGICYEKLGQREARIAYQTVIDKYPRQIKAVEAAKERISRLASVLKTAEEKPKFRKIVFPVRLSWQSPTPNGPIVGFGARLSPDGSTLAFGSEGSIWTIPIPGKVSPDIAGEPRRVTDAMYAFGSGICWSADGEWIGYNAARDDGGENIYSVSENGGKPVRIASRPPMGLASYSYDSSLSLSPDGSMLAFTSAKSNERYSFGIKTISSESKFPKSLNDDISVEPAFSPNGRSMAYVNVLPEKGLKEIKVVSREGGDSILITSAKDRDLRSPVWSPDGKMIAFLSGSDGADELLIAPVPERHKKKEVAARFKLPQKTWLPLAGWTADDKIGLVFGSPVEPVHQAIYTVPASGGKATQVTPSGSFHFPRWSQDGKTIWFLDANTRFALGSVPSIGGKISTLTTGTNPPVQGVPPGWGNAISPDGKKIVFAGYAENVKGVNLWMMPLYGGQPIRLTTSPGTLVQQDRFPCWSHDGKSLLFIRVQGWQGTWYASTNIYMMPAEGGEARAITSASDNVTYNSIACAPDGKYVAYFSHDTVHSEGKGSAGGFSADSIKIKPIQGGAPRLVARVHHTSGNQELSWSPDGTRLAYNADGKIWVVPVGGGQPVEVKTGVDGIMLHLSWSRDGKKLAFTGFRYDDPELWLMEDFLPLVKR
jgi:Tol biopolymer transport system component